MDALFGDFPLEFQKFPWKKTLQKIIQVTEKIKYGSDLHLISDIHLPHKNNDCSSFLASNVYSVGLSKCTR